VERLAEECEAGSVEHTIMEQLGIALLIFVLRILDVSIGTLRVLYMVRSRRLVAAALGMLEAGVFIVAIASVFKHVDSPLSMLGYAAGFAVGTVVGITVERWIASGSILLRVISREKSAEILAAMREKSFGVTAVRGEGRDGPVLILFLVTKRKRAAQAMKLIDEMDSDAFVTVESVSEARGGYLPVFPGPAAVRK
jgi:uncharacterized protein YebE (UPF0316 family)